MKIKERNLKIIIYCILAVIFTCALLLGLTKSTDNNICNETTEDTTSTENPTKNYVVSCIKYHRSDVPEFSDGFISGYYIPSDIAREAIKYYQNAEFTLNTGIPENPRFIFYFSSENSEECLYLTSNNPVESVSLTGVLLTNKDGYSMWCPMTDYPEIHRFLRIKLSLLRYNIIAETLDDTFQGTTFTSVRLSSYTKTYVPDNLAAFALHFCYYPSFRDTTDEINFDKQSLVPIGTFHLPDYTNWELNVTFVSNNNEVQGIIFGVHHTGKPVDTLKEDNISYYSFEDYPEAEYFYELFNVFISQIDTKKVID